MGRKCWPCHYASQIMCRNVSNKGSCLFIYLCYGFLRHSSILFPIFFICFNGNQLTIFEDGHYHGEVDKLEYWECFGRKNIPWMLALWYRSLVSDLVCGCFFLIEFELKMKEKFGRLIIGTFLVSQIVNQSINLID